MEIKELKDLSITEIDDKYEIKIGVSRKKLSETGLLRILELYLADIPIGVKITPKPQFRSLSANNYAWHLISEIAKAITSTKEEVYQQLIKDYGVCAVISIKADNYETFAEEWRQNGLGYFTEVINTDGENVDAFFYRGIHSYNNSEMHNFLEGVIYEAQELDIEVRTPEEIRKSEENWRHDYLQKKDG